MQACVAPIAHNFSTCGVRSRSSKVKGFDESIVYIKIPLVRCKVAVYLTPGFNVTSVSSSIVHLLLRLERTVSFWKSLLPRLPSLPATDLSMWQ